MHLENSLIMYGVYNTWNFRETSKDSTCLT